VSGKEICGLGDHSYPPVQLSWWDLPVVATFKPHRPACGFIQAIEQTQKGRFARTARPDHDQDTAPWCGHRHAVDDANARDSPAKVFRFEYRFRWRKNRSLEVSKCLSVRCDVENTSQ